MCCTPISCLSFFWWDISKRMRQKNTVVISGWSQSIERNTESTIKQENPKPASQGAESWAWHPPCPPSPGSSTGAGARLYFCQIEMCLSICWVLNRSKRFAKPRAAGQAPGERCCSPGVLAAAPVGMSRGDLLRSTKSRVLPKRNSGQGTPPKAQPGYTTCVYTHTNRHWMPILAHHGVKRYLWAPST